MPSRGSDSTAPTRQVPWPAAVVTLLIVSIAAIVGGAQPPPSGSKPRASSRESAARQQPSAARQLSPGLRAFGSFWAADTVDEATAAAGEILAAGVGFDEAMGRLRRGPAFTADVPTGRRLVHRVDDDGVEHPWLLLVPGDYDPSKSYPVHFFLHGGVARPRDHLEGGWWQDPEEVGGPGHISVFPYSWQDSPWWQRRQVDNLHGILWRVKRTYNVVDDRVYLFGVSDGGTGAWFQAFRAPTPWAAFLPFIAHPAVLASPDVDVDGEIFVENLRNRPVLAINGGRDRLYPAARMRPYLSLFREAAAAVEFVARPDSGHHTRWWPEEGERLETFLARNPRDPHPEHLWWETEDADRYGRIDWLRVETLGRVDGESAFAAHNTVEMEVPPTLGVRIDRDDSSGVRLVQVVEGSPAARAGLQVGDRVQRVDGQRVSTNEAFQLALRGVGYGEEFELEVERQDGRRSLRVELPPGPETRRRLAFPHSGRSGRAEVHASGNSIEIRSRGVRRVALLLSPDAFDFSSPLRVVANRSVIFEGRVEPRVETLLRWAARDGDRSRLYGAELAVDLADGTVRQRR